jgi:hypothetical protein
MKVANRQNLVFSFFKPSFAWHMLTFGTVSITAGMIGNSQRITVVAAFDVATQMSGAAVPKVGHDFTMRRP